jgi:hypothetical protein
MRSQRRKGKRKILMLFLNPRDAAQARRDEELRVIKDALRRSGRQDFEIQVETAVTISDMRLALMEVEPDVVHFCPQSLGMNGIAYGDEETGELRLIPAAALASLFRLGRQHVRCVVLNACFEEGQANEIGKHIDCVVGMKNTISDRAAFNFSKGFYDALFHDKEFSECYSWGVNALDADNVPADAAPKIIIKEESSSTPPANRGRARTRAKAFSAETEAKRATATAKFRKVINRGLSPNVIMPACLVSLVIAVLYVSSTSGQRYEPLVGAYTQDTFEPAEVVTKDVNFKLEARNVALSVATDPNTGKMQTVELTTVQVTYVPLQTAFTSYTAEWRCKEVERLSPTHIKIECAYHQRYAFNELSLRRLASDSISSEFEQFKMNLTRDFQTSKADLLLENGRLTKRVTYNGGVVRTYTYIRN